MAASVNHEYPTVTGTVVDVVRLLCGCCCLLGELLAVQQFGWQCLMLMHLRCWMVTVCLGLQGFR